MKNLILAAICALATGFAFSSCNARVIFDGKKGDGVAATEERQLRSFKRVVVEGSMDLRIDGSSSASQSVRINSDKNLLSLFKTEVRDSTLHIYCEENYNSQTNPSADLVVPGFSGVAIQGSSDVRAKNISCYSFEVHIDGSGDVQLEGSSQKMYIVVNGSGDVRSENLRADTTEIHINGSGDVAVNCTKLLDVHVNGSGDVSYVGNPESVQQSINGSGTLKPKK